MSFRNYVCWDPDWVEQIMNTEALQPDRHVFLAVHHPVKMFQTTLTSLKGQVIDRGAKRYSEHDLLRDLFKSKDFEFIPVLGDAGTGKSHLVRWLAENISSSETRLVLLVPKVDTNLWSVIDRILALEGVRDDPQFDDYRSRLHRARGELNSEKEGREKLLNNLAVACGENGPHKMHGLTEKEAYLTEHLPSLLYDPFFRESMLRDGGVIDRLVRHTIGKNEEVERLEEKRGFREEDLPLKPSDIKRASEKARASYKCLVGERTLQTAAVDWLNRQLSTAIAELLELRGDALLHLMLEVREALGARGVELVLLIEDFAKLQGIDMQLLEAVIARPNQEGHSRLCSMRTVLACTKGYFGNLLETVQTRVGFCVTLDATLVDAGDAAITDEEVELFASRYLNTARLKESALRSWLEARDSGEEYEPPPNACVECRFRDECHKAFGSRDGVGLYPLTSIAIRNMSQRASPKGFNPRLLIKDVLKTVLGTYSDDIREGKFPSPALLDHFRGPKLSAAVKTDLFRLDTNPATRERRLTLLDLWSSGVRVADLAPGIHEAFSLPELDAGMPALQPIPGPELNRSEGRGDSKATQEREMTPRNLPESTGVSERVGRILRELEEWTTGKQLQQESVNDLRKLVFYAVQERINWDAELLVKVFFSGQDTKRPFRQRSVNFENQKPNQTKAVVRLTLPAPGGSLVETALALQGLLLFDHFKSWKFRFGNHHGNYYLRMYATQLERWAKVVLDQIRRPNANGLEWNPAPAAAELLALTARMANRPLVSKTSVDDQLHALFIGLDTIDIDHRSAPWRELFRTLREHQSDLADILLANAGCTKGGRRKVKVLDASRIIEALREFRKDSRPKEILPPDLWETYEAIRKSRARADELVDRAAREERDRHLAWYDRVRMEMGALATRDEIAGAIRAVLGAARESGVMGGVSKERLEAAIDAFGRERLDQCLEAMERLRNVDDTGQLLIELGRDYGRLMASTDAFIDLSRQFLDATLARAETEIGHLEGAGELRVTTEGITKSLDCLRSLLGNFAGGEQ